MPVTGLSRGGLWAIAFVATSASIQPDARYPGGSELPSPNDQFVIQNEDADEEPHHTLYLLSKSTGVRRRLQTYERHVSVAWSPDSRAIFVNDFAGSDWSTCVIFFTDGEKSIDIRQELAGRADWEGLLSNHHSYVEAIDWLDSETVKVRIHGYGDQRPAGFDRVLDFHVVAPAPRVSPRRRPQLAKGDV